MGVGIRRPTLRDASNAISPRAPGISYSRSLNFLTLRGDRTSSIVQHHATTDRGLALLALRPLSMAVTILAVLTFAYPSAYTAVPLVVMSLYLLGDAYNI